MYPIQLHDNPGTGMGVNDFADLFLQICAEHAAQGQAKAFAFVFYDLRNRAIRDALAKSEGFHRLNESSGKNITVFYMHENAAPFHNGAFNDTFLKALNVDEQTTVPCLVIFRVFQSTIEDLMIFSVDPICGDPVVIVSELERNFRSALEIYNSQGDFSALFALVHDLKMIGGWIGVNDFITKLIR